MLLNIIARKDNLDGDLSTIFFSSISNPFAFPAENDDARHNLP